MIIKRVHATCEVMVCQVKRSVNPPSPHAASALPSCRLFHDAASGFGLAKCTSLLPPCSNLHNDLTRRNIHTFNVPLSFFSRSRFVTWYCQHLYVHQATLCVQPRTCAVNWHNSGKGSVRKSPPGPSIKDRLRPLIRSI